MSCSDVIRKKINGRKAEEASRGRKRKREYSDRYEDSTT
jgi:hypothetical protein